MIAASARVLGELQALYDDRQVLLTRTLGATMSTLGMVPTSRPTQLCSQWAPTQPVTTADKLECAPAPHSRLCIVLLTMPGRTYQVPPSGHKLSQSTLRTCAHSLTQ